MAGDVDLNLPMPLWAISATRGSEWLQLNYDIIGATRYVSVNDFGDKGKTKNFPPEAAAIQGHTLTVTYPVTAIRKLGERFEWAAAINLDGYDVDQCPGVSPEDPKARFPG